jgi:hypothetical protein
VCPPVVMISRMDAQDSVHAAYSTTNGTSDDSTKRTGGPASLRGAPLHSSEHALSMNHGRSRKHSRYCDKLQHLQHVCLQITA